MDSSLYNASVTGNIDTILSQTKNQQPDQVLGLRAPNSNTILHLASQCGQTEAVQAILSTHPSLITALNSNNDSALHLASRGGHTGVVRALIVCAKKLDGVDVESGLQTCLGILQLYNKEGDTVLHEAIRYNHIQVVRVLLEEIPPSFVHPSNMLDETPLYLAASRGFHDLVDLIISACDSPDCYGPDGRTALHGAVICNSKDCTRKLLEWRYGLVHLDDHYSQTPLHYAARLGFADLVRELLSADESIAYIANNDEQNTALFIAASAGHISIMKELITHCPSCCDMVNAKGRNVLHIAIEHEQKNVIEYLLEECPTIISSLIIQKDTDGNTPLHLLSTSNCFVPKLIQHPLADKGALNNKRFTPLDLANYNNNSSSTPTAKSEIAEELKRVGATLHLPNAPTPLALDKADEENFRMNKMAENHMLVAALIATVAFTAGFTMPGGYIQSGSPNQGMAVLGVRSIAFQAFIISDTVALLFSTSALFAYFLAANYLLFPEQSDIFDHFAVGAMFLNMCGLGAMIVAFITGTYAVLQYSLALAIAACVVASCIFLIHSALLTRFIRDVNNRKI